MPRRGRTSAARCAAQQGCMHTQPRCMCRSGAWVGRCMDGSAIGAQQTCQQVLSKDRSSAHCVPQCNCRCVSASLARAWCAGAGRQGGEAQRGWRLQQQRAGQPRGRPGRRCSVANVHCAQRRGPGVPCALLMSCVLARGSSGTGFVSSWQSSALVPSDATVLSVLPPSQHAQAHVCFSQHQIIRTLVHRFAS